MSCHCFECLDAPELGLKNPTNLRMVLCPECGNKRCPKATSHEFCCTSSNEPGQSGSRYPSNRAPLGDAAVCQSAPVAPCWQGEVKDYPAVPW